MSLDSAPAPERVVLLPPVPRVVEPAGATGIEARALRHDAAHIESRKCANGGARVRRDRRVEAILVVEELVAGPREARADAGRPPLEDGPRLVPPEQTKTHVELDGPRRVALFGVGLGDADAAVPRVLADVAGLEALERVLKTRVQFVRLRWFHSVRLVLRRRMNLTS